MRAALALLGTSVLAGCLCASAVLLAGWLL
jgi:hypothetical protein